MTSVESEATASLYRKGWRLHIAKTLVFTAIFLPLLAIGSFVGFITGLPDSTGLGLDALYIREQARNYAKNRLPDASLRNEAMRLRLSGVLYDNPEAYYLSSFIEQADGNLDKATTDIELAIGLLEIAPHSHDRSTEYNRRRDDLKQAMLRSNR